MHHPDKGYRRIRDDLEHDFGINVNDKRVLRICRAKKIQSTIKYSNHGCTRNAANPQYVAENVLSRKFHAPRPNVKWLTDVTEFKWYEGVVVHKIYLSAILDLYDRRIVSYIISDHNDNPIVFDTFKAAVKANPDAHPLFHSDRGFQYTNRTFHHMLEEAGMTQSMSRVAHCIDNSPMEGFWGILKRERYYGKRFTSKQELVRMIQDYIYYYNTQRVQRNLGVVTPMEKYQMAFAAKKICQGQYALGSKILFYFIVRLTGCGSKLGKPDTFLFSETCFSQPSMPSYSMATDAQSTAATASFALTFFV